MDSEGKASSSSSKEEDDDDAPETTTQSKGGRKQGDKPRSRSVRLQWDPDHTPSGGKALFRKAMQLGIKLVGAIAGLIHSLTLGSSLRGIKEYSDGSWIVDIQDVTPLVREQALNTSERRLDELKVPVEKVFYPSDVEVANRIRLDKDFKTERDSP